MYQSNGIDRESVRYRDEEGTLTKSLYYYNSGNKLKWEIEYDDEGKKSYFKVFDESTGKVTSEEWYTDGVIGTKTLYYSTDSITKEDFTYDESGNVILRETYVGENVDMIYRYENNSLIEISKAKGIDGLEWTEKYKVNTNIKTSLISYDEVGKIVSETIYNEETKEIAKKYYYNHEENIYLTEVYEKDLVISKDYTLIETEKNNTLDEEMTDYNNEMNSYVEIGNKIEYKDEMIEQLVEDNTEAITDSESIRLQDEIKNKIDSINEDIVQGEVSLDSDGEIIQNDNKIMPAAYKNGGPKFYWWGVRNWYNNAKAKRVADLSTKCAKVLQYGGGGLGALSMFATHPALIAIARSAGVGIGTLGRKMEIRALQIKLANKGHRRGVVVDTNWLFTSKAYSQ